jgi:hypothetical protein
MTQEDFIQTPEQATTLHVDQWMYRVWLLLLCFAAKLVMSLPLHFLLRF